MIRVGQGYDVHQLVSNRKLILGGVLIDFHLGLKGHSDADVLIHAIMDALLGASGMGDIGQHFPDTEPQWKNVDSLKLLEKVVAMLREAGYEIGNVDCSVVCERPKLAPHRDAMQQNLSKAAGAPVSVKGRRAEGLGALGREEGIACWAVAVIERKSS